MKWKIFEEENTSPATPGATPTKSKMVARGPQNGQWCLQRCLPLDFLAQNKFFDPSTPFMTDWNADRSVQKNRAQYFKILPNKSSFYLKTCPPSAQVAAMSSMLCQNCKQNFIETFLKHP